jgi:hypothetical protein
MKTYFSKIMTIVMIIRKSDKIMDVVVVRLTIHNKKIAYEERRQFF